ncbi:MAG TPA: DsrE family protein [Methanoregula sp.]|nr:DsrE family protein [Methanoregula sp.]
MTSYFILLSDILTQERLSWIDEILKNHFLKGNPEKPDSNSSATTDDVAIYVTGDALYSFNEIEVWQDWSAILSLPKVRLICDKEALDLLGIKYDTLKERFPDLAASHTCRQSDDCPAFWTTIVSDIFNASTTTPVQIGWLETETPYMNRSVWHGIQCLSAALDAGYGAGLYAYLDGCHVCHTGQAPDDHENIGAALEELESRAVRNNLPCSIIINRDCASTRGYTTWNDGLGTVISACTIRPAHIRDLDVIIRHIKNEPFLLSKNSGGSIFPPDDLTPSKEQIDSNNHTPSVVILVTHSPYSTGYVFGGIAFAAACSHQGIHTSVVFLEDGIFAVSGEHRTNEESDSFTVPDLLALLSNSKNLDFYALASSFQRRGLSKNGKLTAVKEIDFSGLSRILFYQPADSLNGNRLFLMF